ncbi:hypothetical protein NQ315_007822 [Exocentrus adspersus]|uniref:Nuclear RNA export factor 2 n=1 Tax=Exocentrus adspersus TaxID=1586481 RepID=A0AAV8W819_9CUCU|nr:hypothetical protein NQ315_007822 [Exocentrus adspersus]
METQKSTESAKLVINQQTLGPALYHQIIAECGDPNYWHKFEFSDLPHAKQKKNMKFIREFFHPIPLEIFKYRSKKKEAAFFTRNCLDAIKKIISTRLQIPTPDNLPPARIVNADVRFSTEYVLKCLKDFVPQLEPINIIRKHRRMFFLARNCFSAIMKLFENRLRLPAIDLNRTFTLLIRANVSPVDTYDSYMEDNIKAIVLTRYDQNKTLNLSSFHTDIGLTAPCSLSDPNLLIYVMNLVVNLEMTKICLAENAINDISPISLLCKNNVTEIDLSHNQLINFKALECLRDFKELISISLDGNPLCSGMEPNDYIANLKEMFPQLKSIDGVNLDDPVTIPPTPKANLLCVHEGGDLVEQFLEYFFTEYDKSDRSDIAGLYHEDAMLSVTYTPNPDERVRGHFISIKRDICDPAFIPKTLFLFQGRQNIMKIYKTFPQSLHDPHMIQTDLIYYTGQSAVLVVHGIFREGLVYLGFARNFVLESTDGQEYCIRNEQLHVYHALQSQIESSYQLPPSVRFIGKPVPYLGRQYWELQEALHLITGLNFEYSRRYLEEFHYDLNTTLAKFSERHICNQIPKEAFKQDKVNYETKKKYSGDPHSKEFTAKVIASKGCGSKQNVYQMLTDEKLKSTVTRSTRKKGKLSKIRQRQRKQMQRMTERAGLYALVGSNVVLYM